jgi:hypothetical protein
MLATALFVTGCVKLPTDNIAPPGKPVVESLGYPSRIDPWRLRLTSTDPHGHRVRFRILVNGVQIPSEVDWTSFTPSGTPYSLEISVLSDGRYRLQVQAEDAGENLSPLSDPVDLTYNEGWMVYTQSNSSLPSDHITALMTAGYRQMIGTADAGLALFNGLDWQFLDTSTTPLGDAHVTCSWPVMWQGAMQAWVGTRSGGLRGLANGQWRYWNTANGGLPSNHITALVFSPSSVWIGMDGGGAARADTTTWTWRFYNAANSSLPSDHVTAITLAVNQVWIGTDRGLAMKSYPGEVWTNYSTANSPLPSDVVTCLDVDATGGVWVGTEAGLAVLRGTDWTVYRRSGSPLPDDQITALAAGDGPAVWIGTASGGAARFDSGTWRIFNTGNSPLPSDHITALSTAWTSGAPWFGTDRGLANLTDPDAALLSADQLRARLPKINPEMEAVPPSGPR